MRDSEAVILALPRRRARCSTGCCDQDDVKSLEEDIKPIRKLKYHFRGNSLKYIKYTYLSTYEKDAKSISRQMQLHVAYRVRLGLPPALRSSDSVPFLMEVRMSTPHDVYFIFIEYPSNLHPHRKL